MICSGALGEITAAGAQVGADDYVGAGSTCGNALALIDESHKSWDALIQLEARADNNAGWLRVKRGSLVRLTVGLSKNTGCAALV